MGREETAKAGSVFDIPWFIALSSSHAGNTVINRNDIREKQARSDQVETGERYGPVRQPNSKAQN
jgi:hypothetical protein